MNLWDAGILLGLGAFLIFVFLHARKRKRDGRGSCGCCDACGGCAGRRTAGAESIKGNEADCCIKERENGVTK